MADKTEKHVVVFDIETLPFSDEFRKSKTIEERIEKSPKMRVCCLYDVYSRKYKYYTEENVHLLLKALNSADKIVTYNGKVFDLLVLAKHYGLEKIDKLNKKHVDMLEIMSNNVGYYVSLDKAAKLNLNEKKHTKGREMNEHDLTFIMEACKSDVSQTYRLWKMHENKTLKYPKKTKQKYQNIYDVDDIGNYGIGSQIALPPICPYCGDVGSLAIEEYDAEEIDDMTEGQFADYMAGFDAVVYCETCNTVIDDLV